MSEVDGDKQGDPMTIWINYKSSPVTEAELAALQKKYAKETAGAKRVDVSSGKYNGVECFRLCIDSQGIIIVAKDKVMPTESKESTESKEPKE